MQVGDNYTSRYSKRNLLCVFSLYEAFTIDTLSYRQSLLHILTSFPTKLATLLLDFLPNKFFFFLTSENKYYIV